MTVRERILTAARQLAAERPVDSISLADVARAADVSWPTVRRHIGGKTHLKEFLASERLATTPPDRDTPGPSRGKPGAGSRPVRSRRDVQLAAQRSLVDLAGQRRAPRRRRPHPQAG